MRVIILLAILAVAMSGCASTQVTLPTEAIADVSKEAGKGLITVADASVAKEAVANKTVQTFIKEYGKAHKASGTIITFGEITKTVMIDGHELVYTETGITQIETREMPTFNNVRVSQQPSVHPGWAMAQNVINTGIKWGVGGFVADGMFSAFESAWDRATYEFTGNPNLSNSFNTAGTSQNFTAAEQGQFAGDGGFCGGGDCGAESVDEGSEWYNGIVGCSSEESYLNGWCSVKPEGV